jgi:hypothetical protein
MAEEDPDGPQPRRVAVNLTPPADAPHGVYCNFVQIRPTQYDFVLDFGHLLPPDSADEAKELQERGEVTMSARTRIVLPVAVVPQFVEALRRSLHEYAKAHGLTNPAPEKTAADE